MAAGEQGGEPGKAGVMGGGKSGRVEVGGDVADLPWILLFNCFPNVGLLLDCNEVSNSC